MSEELGREVEENWGLLYANKKRFITRYCYTVYLADEGHPLERVCNYKDIEEAREAMNRRVEELRASGFTCNEADESFLGAPIYVCQGVLRDRDSLAREVELVIRLDVEKEPRLGRNWRRYLELVRMKLNMFRNWSRDVPSQRT